MYRKLRATGVAASALVVAVCMGVVSMFPVLFSSVAAAGTTVLVMGGTGNPLSTPPDTIEYVQSYTSAVVNNFVLPSSMTGTGIPGGPYNTVAAITPERSTDIRESIAEGLVNLDGCIESTTCDYNEDIGSAAPSRSDTFVVFGYSQSAAIAMLEKAKLAADYAPGEGPEVSFVVTGSSRPNGGLASRDVTGIVTYLLLGVKRSELITDPVPTDTQYSTVDIARQYDGFADFPQNPLNLVADLNAYVGILQLHGVYDNHSLSDPGVIDQGKYGDTAYYMISTPVLPLLMPLQTLGPAGSVLADALDPALRVIVESAYDRTISPGAPTPFNRLYFPSPVKTAANFLVAIPTGLDNALQDTLGVRPFGTQRPGPYGVGGPSVDYLKPEPVPTLAAKSDTNAAPPAATPMPTPSRVGQLGAPEPLTSSARHSRRAASSLTMKSKSSGRPKSTESSSSARSSPSGSNSSERAS